MKIVVQHRALLIFLGGVTLVALVALFWCGPGSGWIIDLLAAILAVGAVFFTGAGLIIDAPHARPRRFWLAALILSLLLCVGGVIAAFADPAGRLIAADVVMLLALELYLLGAVVAVAAARQRQFALQHRVEDVGDFARHVFVMRRLFSSLRHPSIGLKKFPGGKPALDLCRFVWWFPQMAPRVRAKIGIGIWRQFCEICVVQIRHGLDTQNYYMLELYRSEVRARASGYLTRYETKNGLFKLLTWNLAKRKRSSMLSDKLATYRICQEHGIATVPILVLAKNGELDYRCERPAGLQRDLFIKPVKAKGSRGAESIRYQGGKFVTEGGATLDHGGLEDYVAQKSKETPILVQPRIANHPGLADLADQALMRIRAVTCLDAAGKPVFTHAVLSNLCKLELNWATDFELGAMVDVDTGILGRMTGDKGELWLEWSDDHPVTHARVLGRIVPCWDEVRAIALNGHRACNDRLLIGWDIAVGPEGALLLEGNSYPDVDFLQRSHQCAIGDSTLGPLLYTRLLDIDRDAAAGKLKNP